MAKSRNKKLSLFEAITRTGPASVPPTLPSDRRRPNVEWAQPVEPMPEPGPTLELPAPVPFAADTEQATHRVRISGRRISVSMGPIGCMMVTAFVVALCIASYSAGRRSESKPAELAAIRESAQRTNPLLPRSSGSKKADAAVPAEPEDVDLSRLLQTPPAREASVIASSSDKSAPPAASPIPVPGKAAANRGGVAADRPLQYLQIETFRVVRGGKRSDVLAEMEDVRRFLAARGIESVGREISNGYVLLSRRGFEQPNAADARSFRETVERLGQEYRRSGGRYEFRGCDYVSGRILPGQALP